MTFAGQAGPLILGFETSCDETAAAVVGAGTHVYSNVIATQHELHRRYAGVVPDTVRKGDVLQVARLAGIMAE